LAAPRTVGEIDGFITMLLAACDSQVVYDRLESLLSLPDPERQALVYSWVNDLLIAEAPRDFVQAIACLLDDQIAEKAYEVIFKCRRGEF
jgi:hypothetical protein